MVESQQLAQDMIDMVDIFDENAELNKDGYIIGPSFKVWDWSQDIVRRYKEYVM